MAHNPAKPPDAGLRPGELAGSRWFATRAEFWRQLAVWPGRIWNAVLVTALGILLGQQYMQPNKRVLPVMAAVVIAGLAWRLDLVTSVGVMFFLLPYPKGTTFGTTNVALALLVAIIWLVNASMGRAALPRRTPVDAWVVGLVIMYACSFYNISDAESMSYALTNTEIFLAAVLCYYITVANVNSTRALEKLHLFQMACAASVFALALYELRHPGPILGGWIVLGDASNTEGIARHNQRVGSSFYDYELLSEFCVITMLLAIFLWARARTTARKAVLGGFLLINLFVMFATVTRGAMVSLSAGLLTMLWSSRRRLQFVPTVIGVTAFVALFIGMNFYVAHFTASGDMFARLSTTHFEGGVPDSRVGAWGPALMRALRHPWIGGGPYYRLSPQEGLYWPHNVYLYYAVIVGFPGVIFWLLILAGFARMTAPRVDSLRDPDYARAFQIVAQAQLVAFAVNETKIDYLRNTIYTPIVWSMFSVWAATYFIARKNETAQALAARASAQDVPAPRPSRAVAGGSRA